MRKVASLKTATDFRAHVASMKVPLPFDETVITGPESPLAQPFVLDGRVIGNRFAVLPMEGWDGTTEGQPTELTRRRWQRFGLSGAKLIFGGEAVAVRPDGRGSRNQLLISEDTLGGLTELCELLVRTHEKHFNNSDDLLVGLQLTHSGRVFRGRDTRYAQPKIIYHHPLLDQRYGVSDTPPMTDDEIARLVEDFVRSAALAQRAGFAFVDIKHAHGYLGHEFLSAVDRPGRYGGSFENRTRFLRETVAGIRAEAPGLSIAVRFSAFDFLPFQRGTDGRGEPLPYKGDSYPYAFGGDGTGMGVDLTEPLALLDLLSELNIKLVGISAGAGYVPHLSIPYFSAPFDGYKPPEDPLITVARLISVTAELKRQRPSLAYIASHYSYLQQWLPNVAQCVIRTGMADFAGIGRMSLCYPQIVADVLAGNPLKNRLICCACGDCILAPRHGLVSGCYSRDDFYRKRPEYQQLKQLKASGRL